MECMEKGGLGTSVLESFTEKGTLDLSLPVSRRHQELAVLRAFAQTRMLFFQIGTGLYPTFFS